MNAPRARRTAVLFAALLLAATVVVLGGASIQLKVASFQPFGFEVSEVHGSGTIGIVVKSASAASGLEVNDRILDVSSVTPAGAADLFERLRQAPESTILVQRAGDLVPIAYERPPLRIDFPYLVLAVIGIGYLLIGLYALLRDTRSRTGLFFLWCAVSAAFYLVTPGTLQQRPEGMVQILFAADQLARIILPALTLHLFLVFPSSLGPNRLGRWTPFLYLPVAVQALLHGDLMLAGGRFFFGGDIVAGVRRVDQLEMALLVIFFLAAAAVLAWRLRRERGWEQVSQVRWIALGIAGGYLPFALIYGLPSLFRQPPSMLWTTLAVAPLGLVPLTFAWAILRYKLWDIDVIVRNAISGTLTLMLGVLGFSLANLAIDQGIGDTLGTARNLASFAAGLAIAGLMIPARRGIASGLERFQYRQTWGKRRALTEYGHELLHERDLGRLCGGLLERLEDAVQLERVNLYLDVGDQLRLARPEDRTPPELPKDALGDELWERDMEALSGVALPGGKAPMALRLFKAGYRYVFPLTVSNSRVGLAVTGYREGQQPLNSDDLDLIRQLLDQTALAIENAHLLTRVSDQLEEVSLLQSYTEGILESSPAGIAVIAEGQRIVSANGAFAELVGRDREALAGQRLEDYLPIRPLPTPSDGLVEVAYCEAAGAERHLRISTAEFQDHRPEAGPRRDLEILVVHDVTERIALESALRDKERLAALGALAAGVAHEVNTPITGISSYAQMLLADLDESDPNYGILKKVEKQTFRASQIVNSLLEFARNREHELAPVNLGSLVDDCLDLLRPRLAKRQVRARWQAPPAPIAVQGNEGELQQVLTNLLVNASDALANGGGEIALSLETHGDRAALRVQDNGPGIAPQQLERIFEPFFTTKHGRGGTGLGLAISYEIIQRHGGDLTAASVLGEGTCFTLELPWLRDESESQPA
ncbi:MAG: ATP-binding protein [Acidobacteriota bacterium]